MKYKIVYDVVDTPLLKIPLKIILKHNKKSWDKLKIFKKYALRIDGSRLGVYEKHCKYYDLILNTWCLDETYVELRKFWEEFYDV